MRLLALTLLLATAASAQSPTWDPDNLHEVTKPIGQLSPTDRRAILHSLQIAASDLRAEPITLGHAHAFAVQGYGTNLCGGTGNCEFWIFNASHQAILHSNVQIFAVLLQSHSQQPDILTSQHGSVFQRDATHWQFDGHRYRRTACAIITTGDMLTGNRYEHPQIPPVSCSTWKEL